MFKTTNIKLQPHRAHRYSTVNHTVVE